MKQIKIGILTSINNQQLTVDLGFDKIEKFLKILMYWYAQEAKDTENKDYFLKIAYFLLYCFYDQPVACPFIPLEELLFYSMIKNRSWHKTE